jgi:transposase
MGYDLSKEQQETLNFYVNEFLTPKQIASRRQVSVQAVYKTIKKLKEKGLILGGLKTGGLKQGVTKTTGGLKFVGKIPKEHQKIRLHNIQESIKIIYAEQSYYKKISNKNKLSLNGITVMFYNQKIEIYTQEGISFYGKDTLECDDAAISFFQKFYTMIEDMYNILIEKDRVLNKAWVRRHYALINNEIAKKSNQDKKPIIILDKEDNKQRVITDNSFNLNELETVHPKKAKPDADNLKTFVEDWIENPTLTNSALASRIYDLTTAVKEQKETIGVIMNFMLKRGDEE